MAISITQAKPLLTAAELELFDQSRAEPVKAFNAKQLVTKEKRARTLRDKYRDLYRRQTLAQRGKAGTGRPAKGAHTSEDANVRTQRKAEIMEEVLGRFEARIALLQQREERETGATKKVSAAEKSTVNSRKATPPQVQASKKAAPKKTPAKSPVAAKKVTAVASKASPSTPPRRNSANGAVSASQSQAPLSAVANLKDGADDAAQSVHLTGEDPMPRSQKAPSNKAPTFGGKAHAPDVNAPLDLVPAAERANPVRSMPGNIAIQGHVSSNVRRAQGKRDSR